MDKAPKKLSRIKVKRDTSSNPNTTDNGVMGVRILPGAQSFCARLSTNGGGVRDKVRLLGLVLTFLWACGRKAMQLTCNQFYVGSSPTSVHQSNARIAQLAEHVLGKNEATGSSPVTGSNFYAGLASEATARVL